MLSYPYSAGPDRRGYFGEFGGRFVPETLMPALLELESAFRRFRRDRAFQREYADLLARYAGRPTPLYFSRRISRKIGRKIYLKREDLAHTGSHKINNALGQALLAKRLGKKRIIAETGAGQHGVAAATAACALGMPCEVYMGERDIARQRPNVQRMKLLGARVIPVSSGSRTLKDAIDEAIRDWVTNVRTTHYLLGSCVGPHPYPWIVREFQKVIGREAARQFLESEGRPPSAVIACVGGGSNAIGLFHGFLGAGRTRLFGVEGGGDGRRTAASLCRGSVGVLHGCRTYLLQNGDGQVEESHSVAAGLDYPAVGPEHAYLLKSGRAKYVSVRDSDALAAFRMLSREEGIPPALEPAHAIAFAMKLARRLPASASILVGLSGRGDKDLDQVLNA